MLIRPTASLRTTTQDGDYAMELTLGGEKISIKGQENVYEIWLGIYANDGSCPFNLVGHGRLHFLLTNLTAKRLIGFKKW